MLVWGGPVIAQYCCGQRVALDAVCAPESCCPESDQCCEQMPVHGSNPCCANDGELQLEFTYVGTLEAAVSPTPGPDLTPTVARADDVEHCDLAHTSRVTLGIEPVSVPYEPPDLQLLGVLRL